MVLNMLVKNSLINSYLFYNVLILHIIKSDTYYHKFIYEKITMFLFRSFLNKQLNNIKNKPLILLHKLN